MTALPFESATSGPLAITLRDYQADAVAALYAWFETRTGNPLVVVPTGGGKSLIIAAFCHSVLSQWPSERILVLTHVKELIEQNHRQMLRAWPSAPAGIYSAGLRRREHDARILFAGIQSVHTKAALIGWADLVIVDEAHLIPKSGMGMYRTLLNDLRSINSHLKVIGLTATPYRTGEGALDAGDDRLFDGVAYDCDLLRLIGAGFLSKVTSKATSARIDTGGLHVRMGDFVEHELEQAAMAGDNVPKAVAEIIRRGADRKAWLVFCCSVAHAEAVATAMADSGVQVASVFGDTARDERDRVVADFKAGRLRCVVNVNVLTTGFDAPQTDLIAMLRPTMSAVLYVQMVGRGLRLADGKTDCLVLDFAGNVEMHGPIDAVRVRQPGKKQPGQMLARECPACQTLVSIAATVCPDCGFEWAVAELGDVGTGHGVTPSEAPILSTIGDRSPIERWDVQSVVWRRNEKPGKPATLCVEYSGGFQQRVREWVCFDHPDGSFPYRKAVSWWKAHGGLQPAPGGVFEAMQRRGECLDVLGVTVDTRGEWPEIVGVRLASEPGVDPSDKPSTTSVDLSTLPF